ncbi:MAG: hypothetical protein ABI687_01705 [Flavitalea sp.]
MANIQWQGNAINDTNAVMSVAAPLEGLYVQRNILLDHLQPVYKVTEAITNINPLGRLYNIVQHPSLAFPFLNHSTIINSNAMKGFDQFADAGKKIYYSWPLASKIKAETNLAGEQLNKTSLFSFVVNGNNSIGWITALSLDENLLFGYLWKRSDYPWINLWRHWEAGQLRYSGLEFGTTGLHRPFDEIIQTGQYKVLGRSTIGYIDAGQTISKSYTSFICRVQTNFKGVKKINISAGEIKIAGLKKESSFVIMTGFDSVL